MSCATYCRCVSYPTPTGNGATGATPSWPAARVGWIWLAAALPRRAHWPAATRSRTPPSLGLLSIRLARGGSSRSGKVTSTTKPAAGHAREKPSARLSLVFFSSPSSSPRLRVAPSCPSRKSPRRATSGVLRSSATESSHSRYCRNTPRCSIHRRHTPCATPKIKSQSRHRLRTPARRRPLKICLLQTRPRRTLAMATPVTYPRRARTRSIRARRDSSHISRPRNFT